MVILGRIKDGKIQVQRFFKKDLLKLEGKEVEINPSDSKTQAQLGYLFGVVFPIIGEHTGCDREETYQVYKQKYLSYHKEINGKIYKFQKGLSQCKKNEAMEFIDKVLKHGRTELNLVIPDSKDYEEFVYPEE